jgi:hypothetical protein
MDVETIRDNLSESFGFRVPLSLAQLVSAAQRIDLESALGTMLGFGEQQWLAPSWAPHAMLGYHTFQPEFFCILRPGVDGIEQGLAVHAPEIEREEYPLFESDPSGYNGEMVFLGANLREGLEMLVAHDSCYEDRDEPLTANSDYVALARDFGLSLERKTLIRRAGSDQCYVPPVPDGWKFEKCGDMIGTLAPAELFTESDEETMPADPIERTRRLLDSGYFGSALSSIRRAAWTSRGVSRAEVLQIWADVYSALKRPLLERVVRLQLQQM